jgi:putative hydrolase of the HAD superfamily
MKYDAVIFDLFGTLVDNMPHEEFEQALSTMAGILSVPAAGFIHMWDATWPLRSVGKLPGPEAAIRHICNQLGVEPDDEQVQQAARIRFEFSRRSLVPRHDTIETLARLKSEGYKLGLISDCTAEIALLWPTTSLAPLIDVPIFSSSVGLKKPDPRIFRLACERLGVAPKKSLFMGDGGSNELSGARSVGMFPVLIRVPYETTPNTRRHDEEQWHGIQITAVKDILPFVDEALAS